MDIVVVVECTVDIALAADTVPAADQMPMVVVLTAVHSLADHHNFPSVGHKVVVDIVDIVAVSGCYDMMLLN